MEPEIARLNELRLQAVEARLDAALRAGRHSDVVSELVTLSTEHPYRERFTELQMLALYRSGRQTEALRAYERTRSTMVEELGVDPGPALQALHRCGRFLEQLHLVAQFPEHAEGHLDRQLGVAELLEDVREPPLAKTREVVVQIRELLHPGAPVAG